MAFGIVFAKKRLTKSAVRCIVEKENRILQNKKSKSQKCDLLFVFRGRAEVYAGALATGLRAVAMTCRFVGILLYGGALWLWQNHPVALGLSFALLCALIALCLYRKKKKRRKAA